MCLKKTIVPEILYYMSYFFKNILQIITWIAEKNKRALDVIQSDGTMNLSYKIKKLETLEAEISANKSRVQNSYSVRVFLVS